MSQEFDLRALVREVVDTDTTEDTNAMVAKVRRRIPAEHVEDALNQALSTVVREVKSHGWMRPAHQPPQRPANRRSTPQRPSRKVQVIRDTWRTRLETVRYTVADGSSRRLGDMTVDDLKFVATGLRNQADALNNRAGLLDRLIKVMTKQDAATVRDLTDAALQPLVEAA